MFSLRFISICLLFLYGIPASLGPGWHRHDSACGDCCAVSCAEICDGSSLEADRDGSKTVADGQSSHTRCEHHLDALSDEVDKTISVAPRVDEVDSCAICAFYSQAQTAAVVGHALTNVELVSLPSEMCQQASSFMRAAVQARGPPC